VVARGAMTHERAADRGIDGNGDRQIGEPRATFEAGSLQGRRLRQLAQLLRQKPAIVVTANRDHAVRVEELAAGIQIAEAVGDVPNADAQIDPFVREPSERPRERKVLLMHVPDQPDPHDRTLLARAAGGTRLQRMPALVSATIRSETSQSFSARVMSRAARRG